MINYLVNWLLETDLSKQADDLVEYPDDFDESSDEEYSDESEEDSELNGNLLKKPVSATKLKENRDEEEGAEDDYPDDFEDDSEEEVNNFHKTDQIFAPWCKLFVS